MYDLHAPAFINAMDAAPIPNFQAVWRAAPRPTEEQFAESQRRLWNPEPQTPTKEGAE
jgi:hypothetical protein